MDAGARTVHGATPGGGKTPLVSVVMPVYNSEAFLDASVGSVLRQTFKDFELICFNDASSDSSSEILHRYAEADSRVRVIDSPVNVRQGGGRNRAMGVARGVYVVFLDADDSLVPHALESCVDAARNHDSEAVFFDYLRVSPSRGESERVCQLGADASELGDDSLRRRIAERTTPVWSAMYALRVIRENELYFPENVFYEDNAVAAAIQLSARNPVKINEALYEYRCDNSSVTRSTNNPHFFDRTGSAVMLLDNMKRLGLYDRFQDEIDFMFTNQYFVHTVFGAIYRFDKAQTAKIKEVRAGIARYVPG